MRGPVEFRHPRIYLLSRSHAGVRGLQDRQARYLDREPGRAWATQYNFDALKKGLVKKEAIPVKRVAPMQAFVFNLRRPNSRIRASGTPSTCFSISRRPTRSSSSTFISGSTATSPIRTWQSTGVPQGRELEILNEIKSEVPPEVFTTEWKNPVNAQEGDYRKHQQEALKLFEEAGWKITSEAVDDPHCGWWCKAKQTVGLSSASNSARAPQRQGRADDR